MEYADASALVLRVITSVLMPAEVQIKQFELSEQKELLSFLRLAYPDDPRRSDPEFWKWHTLENPYTSQADIPLWIAKDGDRVVGQVAGIPMELNVNGAARRAIWIVDLVVLEAYRGRGLGKQLMLAGRNYGPPVCALGFNESSGPILLALNWTPLGPISRHQKLLFPGNTLKQVSSFAPLRGLVNLSYAIVRRGASNSLPSNQFEVSEISEFDESFDDLWQRARNQWKCSVTRSSRFLEWQFKLQPGKKFVILGLRDGARLAGYVVLFFRKPEHSNLIAKAAIADIVYDANYGSELIAALLQAALREAISQRAGAVVTDIQDPRLEEYLRKLGFWSVTPRASFMVYDPRTEPAMYEMSNWFLTRADSDVSIFEDPNL